MNFIDSNINEIIEYLKNMNYNKEIINKLEEYNKELNVLENLKKCVFDKDEMDLIIKNINNINEKVNIEKNILERKINDEEDSERLNLIKKIRNNIKIINDTLDNDKETIPKDEMYSDILNDIIDKTNKEIKEIIKEKQVNNNDIYEKYDNYKKSYFNINNNTKKEKIYEHELNELEKEKEYIEKKYNLKNNNKNIEDEINNKKNNIYSNNSIPNDLNNHNLHGRDYNRKEDNINNLQRPSYDVNMGHRPYDVNMSHRPYDVNMGHRPYDVNMGHRPYDVRNEYLNRVGRNNHLGQHFTPFYLKEDVNAHMNSMGVRNGLGGRYNYNDYLNEYRKNNVEDTYNGYRPIFNHLERENNNNVRRFEETYKTEPYNYEKNNKIYKPAQNIIDRLKEIREKYDYENLKKRENDKKVEHDIVYMQPKDEINTEIIVMDAYNPESLLKNVFNKFKNQNKKQINVYDKDEQVYYDKLKELTKEKIDKIEEKIAKLNNINTPLRFRILKSKLPIHNKAMIINKWNDLTSNKLLGGGTEITKYSNWINSLLKVPFKNYKKLPLDVKKSEEKDIGNYLIDVRKTLDEAVYGHKKSKEQITQIIAQWITNPESVGNCIGIQGVMGNGKTTLVKNGISKAIGRPFSFITLGGCSDASYLEGHNYTYEGSMWGKIVDILIECKCMNPVFYFDELDKVSETPRGEEIVNSLIHLTDSSQNNEFSDKYFNGVSFDLSKALFIFSFNDKKKINPILLDRLVCIETENFEVEDKIQIAKNYLLKDIFKQLNIKEDKYIIDDELIKYIIETYTENEGGVRSLKKHLFNIFSKLNLLNLTKHNEDIIYSFDLEDKILEQKEITKEIIDKFIKDKEETEEYYKNWYI